jgi:CRISPR-associated protein Cmr4
MYKGSFLLSFYAETPVHMGSGGSVSYVDLPVQRERHTSFPVLWGSGIKGVLRNFAHRKWSEEKVNTIFGPEKGEEEYSSCISITDAKILLYPVRSVKGVFAWITCPFVLKRFLEDLKAITNLNSDKKTNNTQNQNDLNSDKKNNDKQNQNNLVNDLEELLKNLNELEDDQIIINNNSKLVIDNQKIDNQKIDNQKIENQKYVALEEFVFNVVEEINEKQKILESLKQILPDNNLLKNDLEKHLAIVSDNVFKDFVNYAVEIRTRIRIDQAKGTVEKGALFTEELIPSESIFYSLVFISEPKKNNSKSKENNSESKENNSEKKENNIDFEKVKELLTGNLFNEDPLIQFGGDETTGKGFFRVKLYTP